ncbi:hypothetical protein BT69DRAFT_355645 [Atractiella rhizophila]|nr:hypothetical protein BT69DRAFT_355645 [Atractiella rhizophila]
MPLLGEGKADQIVATDLDEVVPLLRKNLESSSSVQVRPLSWGSDLDVENILRSYGVPNLILASDTVYFPFLHPKLLSTPTRPDGNRKFGDEAGHRCGGEEFGARKPRFGAR